ncbi:ribonuclease H-like domain-containing protein [Tanacetum coccineum]
MDLFGPVSPMSINHEKYTIANVEEYSRYTWVHFLMKKSEAAEMINGVAERKNKTFIKAARTMLNGSVLSKHFWTKAVKIAYYAQNRSIIVKRHDKNSYEIFKERIPGDEEEEYPFVNKYPSFQEESIVLVEEESCPVYDIDNEEEEESMPVYDTNIEDVIEEEEGFFGKGGFGGEEDNIEDVVVVANELCSSMIQTNLSVAFEEDIYTKSHELMSFEKRDTNLDATSTRDE